jgi:hypothetical protein
MISGNSATQPQEPDWKTIAQAAMQQRDEANRNLCNIQIEMAVMADKLKAFEADQGEISETAIEPSRSAKKASASLMS